MRGGGARGAAKAEEENALSSFQSSLAPGVFHLAPFLAGATSARFSIEC